MKILSRLKVFCAFILFAVSFDTVSAQQLYQGGGRVTLVGQVIDSACALDANSIYQVIEFDPLPMGQLIRLGESAPRTFTLRLVKCSLVRPDPGRPGAFLPDWQHVRVTFDGQADSGGKLFPLRALQEVWPCALLTGKGSKVYRAYPCL